MHNNPWGLKFFDSGEWQVIEEHLADLRVAHVRTTPERRNMFRSLHLTSFDDCRVVFVGQSPDGRETAADGLAFSTSRTDCEHPAPLACLLKEYSKDLRRPLPLSGNLEQWAKRGVLLWNAIPTAVQGRSLAHEGWVEYDLLNKELIEKIDQRGKVCFVFFGKVASRYARYATEAAAEGAVFEVAFPTAAIAGKPSAFEGCRIFSTVNAKLREMKLEPIDWLL